MKDAGANCAQKNWPHLTCNGHLSNHSSVLLALSTGKPICLVHVFMMSSIGLPLASDSDLHRSSVNVLLYWCSVRYRFMPLRKSCQHTEQAITGVGNVKQVSFKSGPEDCYGRCGSDKIWQTVPETCSGDREGSVTDSKESGAADNQWWRWTGTESLTSLDICHLTKLASKIWRCGPV